MSCAHRLIQFWAVKAESPGVGRGATFTVKLPLLKPGNFGNIELEYGHTEIVAVALTAYAGEMNQQQALAAGFQRHVTKPVDPEHLVNVIVDLKN